MTDQSPNGAIPTRDQIAVEDTWDLTTIFPTGDAWEAEAAQVPGLIERAVATRGTLTQSPESLAAAIKAVLDLQLSISRLTTYASLRRDEDTTNATAVARYEKAISLAIQAGEALSFLDPEILAMPEEKLRSFIDSPVLADYRHMLEDLDRHRPHVRSEEVEQVLAQMSDVTRTASEAFSALDNADLSFGVVHDDKGNEVELTKARYGLLLEGRDRAVRLEAHEALSRAYAAHAHTFASLYGSSVRKDAAAARIRGYDSAIAEALFDDAVPESVYDSLLSAVRDDIDIVARYHALRKRALGLDELQIYDLRVPLAPEPVVHYDYRDAVKVVLGGLGLLGETYTTDLGNGFTSRWVDVHETKGKRSGAYSWGVYGAPPVMLMNWNGTLSDVFTLAHESGHAMHTFYANRAQPLHYAHYSIFLAEIASTVNEVLLNWHLMKELAKDDPVAEFGILNRFAETYHGTVVAQAMYADFEKRVHAFTEQGQPLTLELLNETFGQMNRDYSPGLVVDQTVAGRWMRVPHFYRAFYVFQYATGLSAAIALATALRDEGEPARRRYLKMLEAGGSDYPLNLLKEAGVDLTTPEPVKLGLKEFGRIIDEMERLEGEGVLAQAQERMAEKTTA